MSLSPPPPHPSTLTGLTTFPPPPFSLTHWGQFGGGIKEALLLQYQSRTHMRVECDATRSWPKFRRANFFALTQAPSTNTPVYPYVSVRRIVRGRGLAVFTPPVATYVFAYYSGLGGLSGFIHASMLL
jgi:hypothetical protein